MKAWTAYSLTALTSLACMLPALANDYETVEIKAAHLGGMTVGFNVILPSDYAASERRYPVLYLLHGYTDHYPAWVSYTNLADYAHRYREIIVMPEGDNGFYTNSATDPRLAWEDFLILDLIPYVDGHYRTVAGRQGRAIAGLSMGGYGAMKLGLKYPHLFAAAASLSGALKAAVPENHPNDDPVFQKLIEGVFGPRDNPERARNDPFTLIRKLRPEEVPQLFLAIGSQDFLLQENRDFVRLLGELKIPYEYQEVPGQHEWPVWDREIQVVLERQAPVVGAR